MGQGSSGTRGHELLADRSNIAFQREGARGMTVLNTSSQQEFLKGMACTAPFVLNSGLDFKRAISDSEVLPDLTFLM